MKKNILLIIFIQVFFLSLTGYAAQTPDISDVNIPTHKYILDNGMTVLITEMPDSFSTSVYALVKTGSATEGKLLGTGISHFLEHMLFKGTKNRKVGQIGEEIKSLGGFINASTSFDFTIYVIDVPSEHFAKALEIEADMLMNALLDPKEVESERKVVFNEMRMHNDNPKRKLSELTLKNAYTRHPYRHPIIGYEELLRNVSRDEMWNYYKKFYSPNNTILSIAGNVDRKTILPQIKEAFKDYKQQTYVSRSLPIEPQQIGLRYYEHPYPTDLTRLTLAYHSVSTSHEDLFALDVLSMILGRGKSSRMHKELYEKKRLVHSVGSSNYTPMDAGLFEVYGMLDYENTQAVIKTIKEQIDLIKKKGVSRKELEKTKKQVVSDRIFGMQKSGHLAWQTAIDEAFTGNYQFSKNYIAGIRGVTNDDVKRVAKQYLIDDNLTTIVLKPIKQEAQAEVKVKKSEVSEIEKIVLENGLTVLLKENHSTPIVSVHLALYGGTLFEDDHNNGIFDLMTKLWTRETKSKPPEVMAELLESKAIGLRGFSGRNSFGLSLDVLAEDFNEGFDIFEDVIKNPQFSETEFLKQKEKTLADIRTFKDSIFKITGMALREMLFLGHHFRLEPLGTKESLSRIKVQDIHEMYEYMTIPNQMVMTVFGDIDRQEVKGALKKKFSNLKPGKIGMSRFREGPLNEVRKKQIEVDKEQAMVMIGFHGPAINSPDRYVVDLLTNVLGSPLSGRMFNKIRDEFGEAYALGAGYQPGIELGMIYFYVLTNDKQVDQVVDIVFEQLKQIRKDYVTDLELKDAKSYESGTFKMGIETNSSLGFTVVLDELYGLGYNYYQSHDKFIDAITKEDIKRVAVKYLDPAKAAIIKARPEKK